MAIEGDLNLDELNFYTDDKSQVETKVDIHVNNFAKKFNFKPIGKCKVEDFNDFNKVSTLRSFDEEYWI